MKPSQLAALLLLAALTACHKDDQTQPGPGNPTPQQTTKKLVGFTYQGVDINPLVIKYDAKGRVIHQSDGEDITDVSYTNNEVHIVSKRTSVNSVVYNFTGKLNAQGFVTEGSAVSAFNGIPRNVVYTFEYDAAGYLKRVISNYSAGESIYDYRYTYKNGDMANFEVYVNGVYDYGGAWEYDQNTEDRSGLSLAAPQYWQFLYRKTEQTFGHQIHRLPRRKSELVCQLCLYLRCGRLPDIGRFGLRQWQRVHRFS